MVERFSPEWVAHVDDAIRGVRVDVPLVIQQVVFGDGREWAWHLDLGPEGSRARPGHAATADVTFTQDRDTAEAVATGELSASAALTAGRLRVRGATARLTEHREALARIDGALHRA